MTSKTPFRMRSFKRVTEAFGYHENTNKARLFDNGRGRNDNYQHSSTTTSNNSSPELSDLINAFMEKNENEDDENHEIIDSEEAAENYSPVEMLKNLFGQKEADGPIKQKILQVAEEVFNETTYADGYHRQQGLFKRSLVTRLRERGFDSGLCKTHWEKMTRFPAGEYEYDDVIVGDTRYIIEVGLAGEFTIARPTNKYLSLLAEFPQIFVGKQEELKQVVMIMSEAAKESLKSNDMPMPPWRRIEYMEAKWFSSYKRVTNINMILKQSDSKPVAVVVPTAVYHHYCRIEVSREVGLSVGKLAQALSNGVNIGNGM
ncbi:hypothetical protein C5167_039108 [Papaver somniferum]|uniref:DUF506 domain-containing protein n=1 Tax=Papaver somniferum TaxID=3469 RepID=A0A4Y7IBE4_PAPSO|nr:uncharacterized protein LOC113333229 [Papaver somniferum]RZC46154.1 hypothetical protein C5167_039108 [Papaver somniferum]